MPCYDGRESIDYDSRERAMLRRLLCEATYLLGDHPGMSAQLKYWVAEHAQEDQRERARLSQLAKHKAQRRAAWEKLTADERAALGIREADL